MPNDVRRFAVLVGLSVSAIALWFGCGGGQSVTLPPPTQFGFSTPFNLSTGGMHPGSLVIADFNRDGKLDIAVSNYDSNTVSVFLNQGGGVFGAPILNAVQVPISLGTMVSGDFNEDGKPDLLVSAVAGDQFAVVLLGKGDGTFTQLTPIPNSTAFLRGRVADVNGDKHLDLIGCGNGDMGVALGIGDGTFQPETYQPSGPMPNSFLGCDVTDFNHDGKLDILAANFSNDPKNLELFLGDGAGEFQAPTLLSSGGSEAVSIAAADFNGDGKADVLVGFMFGVALLFPGNGDGTLGTPVNVYINVDSQGQGTTVLATDLNGDGKPDALVVDHTKSVLTIKLNSGHGITDQSKTLTFSLASGLTDIASGDLNGDGLPDIVLANGKTNEITVILSKR